MPDDPKPFDFGFPAAPGDYWPAIMGDPGGEDEPTGGVTTSTARSPEEAFVSTSATLMTMTTALGELNLEGFEGTMWVTPVWMPRFRTSRMFSTFWVNVETDGTTNAIVRVGIYKQDSITRGPGELVIDAGTIDVATSIGLQSVTVSPFTLPEGAYWLACAPQNNPTVHATVTAVTGNIAWASNIFTTLPNDSSVVGYKMTGVTGALPNPYSGTFFLESTAPRVAVL